MNLSTAFHPQTGGQSKRTIHVLEDMLRACVIDFGGHWDQFLPLVEYAYNNSYHSIIEMAPFKALYGRRCRYPIGWFDTFEVRPWGTDLLRESLDKVKLIQDTLLMDHSRQKIYADRKVRGFGVYGWREGSIEGFTHEGCDEIWKEGQVDPKVCWSF